MVLLSLAVALMQRSCDRSASETVVHGKRGRPTHQDASPALRRRVGHRLGTATARARRSGIAAATKPVQPLRSQDSGVASTSTATPHRRTGLRSVSPNGICSLNHLDAGVGWPPGSGAAQRHIRYSLTSAIQSMSSRTAEATHLHLNRRAVERWAADRAAMLWRR